MGLSKARQAAKKAVSDMLKQRLQAADWEVVKTRNEIVRLANQQASLKRQRDELGKLIGQIQKELGIP